MSDAPVTVDIDDKEVRRTLERLLRRLADLTPAMRAIGAEMEARISSRFETQTDPSGADWAPWSDRYAEARPRRYPDANETLLDRYGDMIDSLSYQADASSVEIGFGQAYAAYHEWGTETMPRRGLITTDPDAGEIADDDSRAIVDVLADFLGA
jgi:phage virion morphogenesis protein